MQTPTQEPYIFQAFPSWRYSPSGESKLVNNPEEEAELTALGWADSPAAFAKSIEVTAQPAIDPPAPSVDPVEPEDKTPKVRRLTKL